MPDVIDAKELLAQGGKPSLSVHVEKDVALEYDLKRLCAFDPTEVAPKPSEADLTSVARDNIQLLFAELHALPEVKAKCAKLPPPTVTLPREKPLPKPKKPTKWEKFAKSRGIRKRKRSKQEFDEDTQTWKRRFGYDKANDINDVPIIEAKEGEDTSVGPWERARQEKKDSVAWNKNKRTQNLKAATGDRLSGTIDLSSAIDATSKKQFLKKAKRQKKRKNKDHVDAALQIAQNSMVSMGKFDKKVSKHEPKQKRRRKKVVGAAKMSFKSERTGNMDILSAVLGKGGKVNHDRLANLAQQARNTNVQKARKQTGKKKNRRG